MPKSNMTRPEFEDWWFLKGGESEAYEEFGSTITEEDIKKQPSWKLQRCRENAITEAIWDKAERKYMRDEDEGN